MECVCGGCTAAHCDRLAAVSSACSAGRLQEGGLGVVDLGFCTWALTRTRKSMAARCSEWNCCSSCGPAAATADAQPQPAYLATSCRRRGHPGQRCNQRTFCSFAAASASGMRTQELCFVVDGGRGGALQLCQVALVGWRHVGEDA